MLNTLYNGITDMPETIFNKMTTKQIVEKLLSDNANNLHFKRKMLGQHPECWFSNISYYNRAHYKELWERLSKLNRQKREKWLKEEDIPRAEQDRLMAEKYKADMAGAYENGWDALDSEYNKAIKKVLDIINTYEDLFPEYFI